MEEILDCSSANPFSLREKTEGGAGGGRADASTVIGLVKAVIYSFHLNRKLTEYTLNITKRLKKQYTYFWELHFDHIHTFSTSFFKIHLPHLSTHPVA